MRIKITKEQRIVNDVPGEITYEVCYEEGGAFGGNRYLTNLSLQDMKDLRDELLKLKLDL